MAPLARAFDLTVAALVPNFGNLPPDVSDRVSAVVDSEELAATVVAAALAIPIEAARSDVASAHGFSAILAVDQTTATRN